ncbi:MAG: hypothetical protein II206_11725, partial [Bacteroidaceae bacterium]|nr:hypothetical protein [Bacteroidaceae bacterium]
MVRIPQNLNNPLNKGFQLKKNISPVENIFFPSMLLSKLFGIFFCLFSVFYQSVTNFSHILLVFLKGTSVIPVHCA